MTYSQDACSLSGTTQTWVYHDVFSVHEITNMMKRVNTCIVQFPDYTVFRSDCKLILRNGTNILQQFMPQVHKSVAKTSPKMTESNSYQSSFTLPCCAT